MITASEASRITQETLQHTLPARAIKIKNALIPRIYEAIKEAAERGRRKIDVEQVVYTWQLPPLLQIEVDTIIIPHFTELGFATDTAGVLGNCTISW